MTNWEPDLTHALAEGQAVYLAIADALERDLTEGALDPGARLPPQRDLARALGVNLGTVTRAYNEARRRGLTSGEVGRGTFVRTPRRSGPHSSLLGTSGVEVDLGFNLPTGGPTQEERAAVLADIAASESSELFDRYPLPGLDAHRAAGAKLIEGSGLVCDPSRVLVTAGVQHGLSSVLSALMQPGDELLCDGLTYPGILGLLECLSRGVHGVPQDAEGILPDALEAALRAGRGRVLYLMPNVQNPTGATLSGERRRAIADLARRYDAYVIEDDTYGFLLEDPPAPIATLCPERTFFLKSISKALAPGLRIGWTVVPLEEGCASWIDRLVVSSSAFCWMASPITAEIVRRWIDDGTAERVARWKRREVATRRPLFDARFGATASPSVAASSHVWFELPAPWTADELVSRLRERRIGLTSAAAFLAGDGPVPEAVRVCLATPPSSARLETALDVMSEVLGQGPPRARPIA